MHGRGILKTITATTTDHIALEVHGIGAGTIIRITVHSTAHITTLTGTLITVHIIVHGATTHGITEDSMTLGTMEDIGADIMEITGDGMTHGTTITTTADGTTRHTITAALHTSQAANREVGTPTDITGSAHALNHMDSLPEAVLQASHQRLPDQAPALPEVA